MTGNLDIGFLLGALLGAGLGIFLGLAMLTQRIRGAGAQDHRGRFAGPMTAAGGPLPGDQAMGMQGRSMIASGVIRKRHIRAA